MWAAWGLGEVTAVHLVAGRPGDEPAGWDVLRDRLGARSGGGPADRPGAGRTAIVLADPFTFPADDLLERLAASCPGTVVVGGLCAGSRPGEVTFQVDGDACVGGAVVVVVDTVVDTVVSQGCRPVGEPFTVTRSNGPVLEELGSRAALTRLQELALTLDPNDRALLTRSVHVGRVVDEHLAEHGRGDFLVRQVLGTRTASGGLVVGEHLPVGATVQFHLRDADTAHEDLVELLAGRQADGALVFTCNGRGSHLFAEPDHDARTVCELLDTEAVAGLFCSGEIGPVGFRSFLHGFTASVALFRERSDRS
jgi:small ligand-binding sensory domain FIST